MQQGFPTRLLIISLFFHRCNQSSSFSLVSLSALDRLCELSILSFKGSGSLVTSLLGSLISLSSLSCFNLHSYVVLEFESNWLVRMPALRTIVLHSIEAVRIMNGSRQVVDEDRVFSYSLYMPRPRVGHRSLHRGYPCDTLRLEPKVEVGKSGSPAFCCFSARGS